MTKRKAESNKQNALKSTGPRDTSETRYNATKHGLLSTQVGPLDQEMYEVTLEQFRETLTPENALDDFFVRRIALYVVRMERSATLGAEFMEEELRERIEDTPPVSPLHDALEYAATGAVSRPASLSSLAGPLSEIVGPLQGLLVDGATDADRVRMCAAVEGFAAAVEKLPRKTPPSKLGLLTAVAEKFQRHETTYENRLIKLLNEYERIKRLRGGENVPAPVSVNVTVHGED